MNSRRYVDELFLCALRLYSSRTIKVLFSGRRTEDSRSPNERGISTYSIFLCPRQDGFRLPLESHPMLSKPKTCADFFSKEVRSETTLKWRSVSRQTDIVKPAGQPANDDVEGLTPQKGSLC
jgi:hypothetical protein